MTNHFPKNRFKPAALLDALGTKNVECLSDDYFIAFECIEHEFEIYFPEIKGNIPENYFNLAKKVIENINLLDNLVQESCEKEASKSKFGVENFMLELAFIKLKESEVCFRYWGQIVNTEWDAVFRMNEGGNWEKVNF
ncbi:hypothetical protein [Pseudoalteromonas sp. MMG012]|uniref:hypothetical protein n=1 Tax=Pseudoalteromonas sp. MMG012 TaxID=2822686 RepID=UPI001B39EB28|nr:hypothetical protein [Pseudoalteromonas sp. MMG012]MBQ4851116.1 hypothetical protein [Pseudoalteromonas sp. MMG012]